MESSSSRVWSAAGRFLREQMLLFCLPSVWDRWFSVVCFPSFFFFGWWCYCREMRGTHFLLLNEGPHWWDWFQHKTLMLDIHQSHFGYTFSLPWLNTGRISSLRMWFVNTKARIVNWLFYSMFLYVIYQVNWISLAFRRLVQQNNRFKHVTLGFGKLRCAFFPQFPA